MNDKIEQGKSEFEKENYQKALDCFNQIQEGEECYLYAQLHKIDCLMQLKQYKEALEIIDMFIEDTSNVDVFWVEKVRCHLFLHEDAKARNALKELERLYGEDDAEGLVKIAKFYNILNENEKVIEYCDKALAVDENYEPALYEKLIAASALKDEKLIENVSNDILDVCDNTLLGIMPVFTVYMISKKYEKCFELVGNCELGDGIGEEYRLAFKSGLCQKLCEDLNVQIGTYEEVDWDIDTIFRILIDFKNNGVDHGEVDGVPYFIV